MIDWSNPKDMISRHFSVGEVLYLPQWKRYASDRNKSDGMTDQIKENLEELCGLLDEVRDFLDAPMIIHSGYRPGPYSVLVGGTMFDVHTQGKALDFSCDPLITIQDVKDMLEPMLEDFEIRMEKGTTTWIHLDIRAPGPSGRYFTP